MNPASNALALLHLLFLGFGFSHDFQASSGIETIDQGLTMVRGAVNGALLERNGKVLAFYGDPRERADTVDTVLFTDHRRDVAWAGRGLVEMGAKAIVPAGEVAFFSQAESFWSKFVEGRLHDYSQQTTKVLRESLPVSRTVCGGETIQWEGIPIRVLDTPGYTRGSVTYLLKQDGRTVGFTGGLICDDGKLFDLYSLQDAIPEAKIRGYHGYAARLSEVIASLRKVAAEKPDILVPVRGPVITDPQAAIQKLVQRIQALYTNYLSIDALRWYFKDEHIQTKARRVLGSDQVNWMPMGETHAERLPAWILPIDNSRLILSADGSGFLVDCGSKRIVEELKRLRSIGKLSSLEGVFITHYHDDHTDQVPALVNTFGCTVYAWSGMGDVLEKPSAYRLPCLTANPLFLSGKLTDGASWRWKEFEMTSYDFPGQTLYHDALRVKKNSSETIFFIGDSFTPSGIDDYCLQNRNFLHEGMGFMKCLNLLENMPPGTWLINQHVEPAFRFSQAQILMMRDTLVKRATLLRDLSPWDDPNYALDEGWARFYPYAIQARQGEIAKCVLKLMNHSAQEQVFQVKIHLPKGWTLQGITPGLVRVPPRQEGSVEVLFAPSKDEVAKVSVLTADIQWNQGDLREWTEAMISLVP